MYAKSSKEKKGIDLVWISQSLKSQKQLSIVSIKSRMIDSLFLHGWKWNPVDHKALCRSITTESNNVCIMEGTYHKLKTRNYLQEAKPPLQK